LLRPKQITLQATLEVLLYLVRRPQTRR
jgi:hypothetical protein